MLTEQQELSPVAHDYEEKLVSGEDTYYVYICKMCGDETDERFSVGLSIEPNHEEKTCMITGIGTCTDTEIKIRPTISGYTVTAIDYAAFKNCTKLVSIEIPDSVTRIRDNAFWGCTSLKSIVIPDSVTQIESWAFRDCTSLESVTIPDSVTHFGNDVFVGCTGIDNVYFTGDLEAWCNLGFGALSSNPLYKGANLYINNVLLEDAEIVLTSKFITFVREYALCGCESLKSLIISEGVTGIERFAFNQCINLESVVIPKSMETIDWYSFEGCTSLETVYFCGTEEEWDKMSIMSAGDELTNAARFYYSETQPSEGAGYWRYVDGVPTLW